ncbi:MAG: hypothetical protein L0K32_11920, partial [Lacticaseibacillus paracasei]|nr:hypothetical protein [Lacticaseibacillus paracasei]
GINKGQLFYKLIDKLNEQEVITGMSTMLKRFKKQLIDLDLTQAEVARKFGWSSQYVRDLMGGMAFGPAAERNRAAVIAFLAKVKEESK